MKLIDVDAMFEKYVRKYMADNAGKFTEEEWEDKMPVLYEKFGKAPLKIFGGKSAVEYYKSLGGKVLCQTLKAHVEEEVPVSDYLCDALVECDTEDGLIAFIKSSEDEELISYAVNILRDKACFSVLPIYLRFVLDAKTDENLRELMAEVIIENAPHVKEELLKNINAKVGRQYLIEALANCPRDERIFNILISEFKSAKDVSIYAHYLVKYGDERAVPVLLERIADKVIKYSDYQELKYAIEALGGEYTEERDFSSDKTYKKIKNNN